MIKNYFKIAWRNLWKHRTFSIIIVAGMAVAFAAAILLSVTAYDELTFDQFPFHGKHCIECRYHPGRITAGQQRDE